MPTSGFEVRQPAAPPHCNSGENGTLPLVSRCGEDENYAKVPRVMRRDRMYLRKLFVDSSHESNILMHFDVVLADQPAKHPGVFCRDIDTFQLEHEVPNQGISGSRRQTYEYNNRVRRMSGSGDNNHRPVSKNVVTPWKAKIWPAVEILDSRGGSAGAPRAGGFRKRIELTRDTGDHALSLTWVQACHRTVTSLPIQISSAGNHSESAFGITILVVSGRHSLLVD